MMTNQDVLNLTITMPVIWFNAYTVLLLGTIALSTSLKGLGVSGNSYYAAPGTVAMIALHCKGKSPECPGMTQHFTQNLLEKSRMTKRHKAQPKKNDSIPMC
jgi:hypothetical protein